MITQINFTGESTSGVTKGCAEGTVARGRSGRENAKQPQPWAPPGRGKGVT